MTFIRGSAAIAAEINDRPFDKLIFVEKNQDRCNELTNLKNSCPDRDIQIENSDANNFLRGLHWDWKSWRVSFSLTRSPHKLSGQLLKR